MDLPNHVLGCREGGRGEQEREHFRGPADSGGRAARYLSPQAGERPGEAAPFPLASCWFNSSAILRIFARGLLSNATHLRSSFPPCFLLFSLLGACPPIRLSAHTFFLLSSPSLSSIRTVFLLPSSVLPLFSFPPHPPPLSSPWFPHPASLPDSLHQAPAQREIRLLSTSQGAPCSTQEETHTDPLQGSGLKI